MKPEGWPPVYPAVSTTMSDHVPFHLTVAGRGYDEHQLPELLWLMAELSANLESVAKAMEEMREM